MSGSSVQDFAETHSSPESGLEWATLGSFDTLELAAGYSGLNG